MVVPGVSMLFGYRKSCRVDGLAPLGHPRFINVASAVHVSARSEALPAIPSHSPVFAIVLRPSAFASEIAYFVMLISELGKKLRASMVGLSVSLIADLFKFSIFPHFEEGSSLFKLQAIEGYMLRRKLCNLPNVAKSILCRLSRNRENYIQIDIVEACLPCELEVAPYCRRIVNSSNEAKPLIIHRLCSHRESVEAHRPKLCKSCQNLFIGITKCAGICFDCYFRILCDLVVLAIFIENCR